MLATATNSVFTAFPHGKLSLDAPRDFKLSKKGFPKRDSPYITHTTMTKNFVLAKTATGFSNVQSYEDSKTNEASKFPASKFEITTTAFGKGEAQESSAIKWKTKKGKQKREQTKTFVKNINVSLNKSIE